MIMIPLILLYGTFSITVIDMIDNNYIFKFICGTGILSRKNCTWCTVKLS